MVPKTLGSVAAAVAVALVLQVTAAATSTPAATVASRTEIEFFARAPHGEASCAIYDGYASLAEAFCESYRPGRESKATVNAQGNVTTCASHNTRKDNCGLGNAGVNTPTFGYGHRVTVGRFRCVVLHKGVECTVISSGKGFLFNPNNAVRIGPSSKKART